MFDATIGYTRDEIDEEVVNGTREFGFWETIRGILVGGREFAEEVEKALELAELEF